MYSCGKPGCKARLTSFQNLCRHEKCHMQQPLFLCTAPGCGAGYMRQRDMQQHVYQKHGSPEQCLFCCDVEDCDFGSPYSNSLRRHQLGAHPSVLFHACRFPGCTAHFAFTSCLLEHENNHRLMRLDSSLNLPPHYIREPVTPALTLIHSECVYACILSGCHFRSYSRRGLKEHRRKRHS